MDWLATLQFAITFALLFAAARLLFGIGRKPPKRDHRVGGF
jgi:hypothetical protein